MKPKIWCTTVILVMAMLLGFGMNGISATPDTAVKMVPESFSSLAKTVSPGVVHVQVEKTVQGSPQMFHGFGGQPFGEQSPWGSGPHSNGENGSEYRQPGLGSGFIIDKDGTIVTNNHVVENADKISVTLQDGREFDADIVGLDPYTDLALIKVNAGEDLPTVKLGSSDDVNVGEWVVAIGNPFGLDHTVTAGIVSAKGRVIGSGPYDDFIQTDTSINPGNSGGPLINMRGEVIGINTMIIAGGQGIGFAIPIDLAKGIIAQLQKDGEVTRGWLGVTVQNVSGDVAAYYGIKDGSGLLVADTVPGDPADRAGIKPKDIILNVNGKPISKSRDLTMLVAGLGVGQTAKVTVLRDGKQKTLDVQIAKRPVTLAEAAAPRKSKEAEFGFQVADITPEMAQRYNLSAEGAVMVVGVQSGSKADKAGIQKGDVVIEVNRKPVESVSSLKKLIAQYKDSDRLALLVKRNSGEMAVIRLV
jgi:serine protease Do